MSITDENVSPSLRRTLDRIRDMKEIGTDE